MNQDIQIRDNYWLGEFYENGQWKRCTLFFKKLNSNGGSISWPIAEIDIVSHPSMDSCNPHCEIKVSIRNDIIRDSSVGIIVDKNSKELRHVNDVFDKSVIDGVLSKLKSSGLASLPLSLYVCMHHIEEFKVEGDFWNID